MKVLDEMLNGVGAQQGESYRAERRTVSLVDNRDWNRDAHISVSTQRKNADFTQSGSSPKPTRGFRLPIKLAAFAILLVIVGGAIFLGIGAYREIRFNRHLNNEQNRNLAGLEEQVARTNQQLNELAQANGNIIADLSLSTRLWDDYRKGVCLISGTYVFLDPESGRPWRLPSEQTDKSGELSPQEKMRGGLTTEGDGLRFAMQ